MKSGGHRVDTTQEVSLIQTFSELKVIRQLVSPKFCTSIKSYIPVSDFSKFWYTENVFA